MPAFDSGQATWRRSRVILPVPAPAAGSDWSTTVPAGEVWELLTVYATLTTSATVADRLPRLRLSNGDAVWASFPGAAVVAASSAAAYTWGAGTGSLAVGSDNATGIPLLRLEAGSILAVSTSGIDPADAWSAIYLGIIQTTFRRGAIDAGELPDLYVGIIGSIPE